MESYAYLLAVILPILATLKVIINYYLSTSLPSTLLRSQVSNKHILITGASKGLGKSLATILAQAGANVTLIARGLDKDASGKSSLDHAGDEVKKAAKEGVKVQTFAVDAGSYDAMLEAVKKSVKIAGKVEWVVANAGGAWPGYLAEQTTAKSSFEAMMHQNYFSAVNVVKAVMAIAKEESGKGGKEWEIVGLKGKQQQAFPGRVLLVGSLLSIMSFVGYSAYSASKFALRGFAEALRSEFLPLSCSVHIYLPSNMDTPGFAKENELKPAITAKIEGQASTMSAENAAKILLAGALNERFFITNDPLGELIRVCSNGTAPRPNPLTETIASPLIVLILNIWIFFADMDVTGYFKKPLPAKAEEGKKNK
ncbi:3-dehydrosphinganine reductase [Phlyctochytrium planicorne]|nr:3-dehydrosphinganine reductase [Phlyctochytrium planicorne]